MYIQHRSIRALRVLLSTFLVVLMLFHRTHYAAGIPSGRVAGSRTFHVPVWNGMVAPGVLAPVLQSGLQQFAATVQGQQGLLLSQTK